MSLKIYKRDSEKLLEKDRQIKELKALLKKNKNATKTGEDLHTEASYSDQDFTHTGENQQQSPSIQVKTYNTAPPIQV